MCTNLVALNVGGKEFITYRSTFDRFPNSLLPHMLSPDNSSLLAKTTSGAIFLDRDPKFFEAVLNYYRTGLWSPRKPFGKAQIDGEFSYYQLPIPSPSTAEQKRHLISSVVKIRRKGEECGIRAEWCLLRSLLPAPDNNRVLCTSHGEACPFNSSELQLSSFTLKHTTGGAVVRLAHNHQSSANILHVANALMARGGKLVGCNDWSTKYEGHMESFTFLFEGEGLWN